MKRFYDLLLKILFSILAIPFCLAIAVLAAPFILLWLLIAVPSVVIDDIWAKPTYLGENKVR